MADSVDFHSTSGVLKQSNRIAKNTVVLFLRMFILMLLNLYIVRLLLKGLGEDEYGTFNAVAGVVTSLSCLTGVLATATQRFYSFAAGKGDLSSLKKIFSVSVNINVGISLVALLLFETVGLWFVSYQLHIPADRMVAVIYVYEFSCLAFVCTLLQIPYTAAVIANEDMGVFAVVSTGECLLKLLVAALIQVSYGDHLIFYSVGLLVIGILVFLTYMFYGHHAYSECSYTRVTDRHLYWQLISFSSWTFLGSLAGVLLYQGNTVLLYMFFGTLTTAAFAISLQINHAFSTLTNSVVLAFRPGMIRSFAEGDTPYVNQLFYFANKFLSFMLLVIGIPLIFEMDTIFQFWLGSASAEAILFSRLMIVYIVLMALNQPITIIMYAMGLVKVYHLIVESIMLLCLPLSYVLFKCGLPSWITLASMIVLTFLAHIARILCLRHYYKPFSLRAYLLSFVLPLLLLTVAAVAIAGLCHGLIGASLLRLICQLCVPPAIVCLLAYHFFLNSSERVILQNYVKFILKRNL